ncbi:hypothetical protein Bca4012_088719 [Brassica carinata]|uniref:Uncharacterized protein n=1 Tax=Brassica carinata TaxID=52824 RepID=A0A8X7QW65_BRACI|nr:hypothetical protein Bca52824_060468 [Brassica carinata]
MDRSCGRRVLPRTLSGDSAKRDTESLAGLGRPGSVKSRDLQVTGGGERRRWRMGEMVDLTPWMNAKREKKDVFCFR